MQIVIEIPVEVKSRLLFGVTYAKDIQIMVNAIANGTPLPKGHGRLIDADELIKDRVENDNTVILVSNAKTVIPADKENEE